MRLTDIMSGSDLTLYPKISLVLFLAVFATVVARTYSRRMKHELERAARMPLEDERSAQGPSGPRG